MVDYAVDDVLTIKARMAEIARERTSFNEQLDDLSGFDLDIVGGRHNLSRIHTENDYYYRLRLKTVIGH